MNRFTITPEFLEKLARDCIYDYFSNVLMVFAQRNEYKVCLDNKGLAERIYADIIMKYDMLQVWIKVMNGTPNSFEKVSIPDIAFSDDRDLFLSIANELIPGKQLITSKKSLFNDKSQIIMKNLITLIDGDEAIAILQPKKSVINQISYGDNSPNVNGNNNKL